MIQLRPMTLDDVPAVHAIETAAQIDPWTLLILTGCMHAGYHNTVAVNEQGLIVGFTIVSIVIDECHLMNIVVDPNLQRRGIGRTLLSNVLRRAREGGQKSCFLEVRASNQPARDLYESYGFCVTRVRKDYYRKAGGREDGLEMCCALSGARL